MVLRDLKDARGIVPPSSSPLKRYNEDTLEAVYSRPGRFFFLFFFWRISLCWQ